MAGDRSVGSGSGVIAFPVVSKLQSVNFLAYCEIFHVILFVFGQSLEI